MFKGKGFFSRFILLSIILVSCLNFSACFVLPEETQRELERQFQEQVQKAIQDAIDNAIEKVKDESERLWKTAKEKATDALNDLQESAGNTIDKAKEYAGWAVPEQCGFINSSTPTLTAKMDIARAFQDLYKGSGSGRVIGWPDDDVQVYSDSSGKWLYQYFLGGSETRSMMIMKDGESTVYLVPGEWLRTYENLGGMENAGKPVSAIQDYDTWLLWGKDQIQRYAWNGEVYVLMKPGDVEQVMVVPPLFWKYYLDNDGLSELGAALSSYPLDEDKAIGMLSKDPKINDLLNTWKDQPFRIQVFEKGSIIYNQNESFDMTQAENYYNGEKNLAIDVGTMLRREDQNYRPYDTTSEEVLCFYDTAKIGGYLATKEGVEKYFAEMPKILIDAAATTGGWASNEISEKVIYELIKLTVSKDGMSKQIINFAASSTLDSLYSKSIGDMLSAPFSDMTVSAVNEAYEKLQKNRLSFSLSDNAGGSIIINYDPFTQYAWGVVSSECNPSGYLYIYKKDPLQSTGELIDDWRYYYDLSKNGIEIRP